MTIAEQLRAEGRAEGEAEGRIAERIEGTARSVLMVLSARGLHVTEAARQRIETCKDAEFLDHWLVRAATVADADDVFEG